MKLVARFLFLVVLIAAYSCSSNDSTDNPNNENLKLLKSYTKLENGQIVGKVNFVYNEDKIIEITSELDEKTIYTYENDLLILEEQFDYNFSSSEYDDFDEQTTFQYENGVLLSDKAVYNLADDAHNKHKYSLLSNGKILRYDYYGEEELTVTPPPSGSRIFSYTQNNIVSESQTNGEEEEMFRIERTFDDKKNPLFNTDVQSTRQIWALFLSPMSDNNMLTRDSYDSDNELYWSLTYTYEYDEDGYPTSREAFNNLTQEIDEVVTFEYYN